MKFKSKSMVVPSEGIKIKEPKQVVPNQSMSLQEILMRFTRNEALPVGHEIHYHESEDDLEKIQHMDLVDRQEFIEKLETVKKRYEKQEKDKKAKEQADIIEKAKAAIKADLEKQKPPVEAPKQ